MKGLLAVIVLLLAGVIALGFYRGWVHLSTDDADQKPNITLEVDKDKVKADEDKVKDLGHQVKEKTGGRTDTAKDQERRP
ncbi:MAG TPA: hypothetical protein VKA46_02105 [Gemmataceae bacterium]|nr:hypothetical protein [Gemmataceae bacterium]